MDTKEILKKAALLKRNPQLANVIPNSEIISLVTDVLGAFTNLQKAIETNKLKGDKGDDGKTPVAGKDYPSYDEVNSVLSDALAQYGTKYQNLQNELQKAILKASELTNGKDAEITDELIEEIAQMAYSLIELPDFDTLVSTEITRNSEAIRNALELLQGDERLDASAIKGLENFIKTVYVNGSGGIGKQQVYGFIKQAIADGTIPGGTGGGHTIQDEGTPLTQRTNLNFVGASVVVTDDAGNDATVVTITGGGAVDSVNGQTGVVVLDADDIDDTSTTHKFTSASDISKLAGIEVGAEVNTIDTIADTAEIDLTVTARQLSASIVAGSIDESKLDASVNASLDLADSASQPGHTHTASAITDFDTEVSNNTDVAANTAARHAAVTLAGTPDYITISGQTITRNQIDLATDVTGDLPFANLTQLSAHQVLGRAGTGTGDVAGITMGNDTILGRSGSGDVDDLSATQVRTILNVANGATANSPDATLLARANHTGTQLASTISDFAATVRATVLTGLSLATSTAVTATDSILVAIGKLQAQNTIQDTAIALNTAKVTNATHTGDMTGATALTAQPALITGKSAATVASGDLLLIADVNDSNNLKQVTAQSIADLGGAGGNTFNDIYIDQAGGTSDTYGVLAGTRNGSNTLFTVSEAVYATGTLKVWLNGQLMTQGSSEDFVETTPASGTFTFAVAPAATDEITVEYQKVVTNSDTIVTTTTIDELAQDAVGTILVDSAEIDFTYNDGTPSITASIVSASIDESKLDASVNASLDLADSSVQPNDPVTDLNATAHRLFYSDGSGNITELAFGADGTVLTSTGTTTAPTFESVAGTGDVVGPASATDNAIATFDGTTGKVIQNTGATLSGTSMTFTSGTVSSSNVHINNELQVNTITQFNSGSPIDIATLSNGDINLSPNGTGKVVVSTYLEVSDEAYGAGWNSSLEVPTKNAVYDAMITRVVRVVHGATAGTARPSDATYVEWVGSVSPTNATNNDTWIETA